MANPQIEDGYTRLANEILEALCVINLSAYEFRVLMAIFRKTYGYQKKEDNISLSQIAAITHLSRSFVSRALRKLEFKGLIAVDRSQRIPNIRFVKDYTQWGTKHYVYRDTRPWYRQRGICECCHEHSNENAHHIIPKEYGGTNNPKNFLHICGGCHSLIHCFMDKTLPDTEMSSLQDFYNWIMRIVSSNQMTLKEVISKQMTPNKTQGVPQIEDTNVPQSEDYKRKKNTNTKKIVRFTKPTVEEISEYCKERNNEVDPQRYFDFYEAKGWMIGKNKMKDWQAAVRTWEKTTPKPPSRSPLTVEAAKTVFARESTTDKMIEIIDRLPQEELTVFIKTVVQKDSYTRALYQKAKEIMKGRANGTSS